MFVYVRSVRIKALIIRIDCTYMCEEFYKNLGRNIKKRRKSLNLTQQDLADILDMSLNFVGKIEVAFSKPSLDTLIEIARALDTTGSDLPTF